MTGTINRMLAMLVGDHDPGVRQSYSDLEELRERLSALTKDPPAEAIEPLELELARIIMSGPAAKQAYLAAQDEELAEIMHSRVTFFESEAATRPLTPRERDHLDEIKRALAESAAGRTRSPRAAQT